jgi:microcystin-dependent protein
MSFWKWSRTASSNATADGSINWAEGQAPSTVNDSARAMMAAAAKYRDDVSGAIVTTGGFTAFAGGVLSGVRHARPHGWGDDRLYASRHQCRGTGYAQRRWPGCEAVAALSLRRRPSGRDVGGLAGNPYNIPLGGMIEFTGTTAPNGSFVLPSGQAISRTTYATYFAMVGTTYGAGDGSTTFNVIDKRGRVSAGRDDMGGSAASRIGSVSTDSGTISGATLGSSGGSSTHVLTTGEMPSHTHDASVIDPGHFAASPLWG